MIKIFHVNKREHVLAVTKDGRIRNLTTKKYIEPTFQGHYLITHRQYVHRIVAEAFIGKIPKGYHVHHIDGNRLNNHVSNLQIIDKVSHFTHHWYGRVGKVEKHSPDYYFLDDDLDQIQSLIWNNEKS